MDKFTRAMNLAIFGVSPSCEVMASDDWDYLVLKSGDKEWDAHYSRRGEGVRVLKGGVKITRTDYEWIPDERAIEELKALMDSWRARGLSNFAASVEEQSDEEGDTFSVYESLGKSVTRRVSKTFPIEAVKFYKELPHDPVAGFRQLLDGPRSNARLTGLGSVSIVH